MNRRAFIKSLIAAALLPMVEKRANLIRSVPAADVVRLRLQLSPGEVVSRPKKLRAVWKFEQAQDLAAFHSVGMEEALAADIRRQMGV